MPKTSVHARSPRPCPETVHDDATHLSTMPRDITEWARQDSNLRPTHYESENGGQQERGDPPITQ